jgi:hypothetical protein
MSRRAKINAKKRNRRIILISVAAVIVVASVAFALLISSTFNSPLSSYIYKPIPSSLYQQITGVSDSTLSAVGSPSSVTGPSSVAGTPLTSNGKPEVLYIGGDYCPYCAVERWALILALSHFGNFTGIQYMLSSATDINANTPTFTFSSPSFNYTSQYVSFVPVEEYNRTSETTVWHALTTTEQSVFSKYGSGGFPFIDLGNQYVINGVQTTIDLSGQNWTQIASQLSNSSSSVAQGIDGAANKIITAVCKIDGSVPSSVCSQSFATVTLAYVPGGSGSTSLAVSTTPPANRMSEKTRWTT